VSWYFGLCGVAALVGALCLTVSRARLSLFGARTTGVVFDYTERIRSSPGDRRQFMPHVRFVGPGMSERTFVSRMGARPSQWPVGTEVPVAFLERDPRRAEIATFARLWAAPLAMYVLAAGALAAALSAS
jgi:Protein of unknown function (DUF3592)